MERILAGIVCRIVDHVAILVVGLGQRAALNEEGQIGLLAVAVLKRTESLNAGLQPLDGLDVEVDADGVTLVVIVQQVVLLLRVADRNQVRHGIAAA